MKLASISYICSQRWDCLSENSRPCIVVLNAISRLDVCTLYTIRSSTCICNKEALLVIVHKHANVWYWIHPRHVAWLNTSPEGECLYTRVFVYTSVYIHECLYTIRPNISGSVQCALLNISAYCTWYCAEVFYSFINNLGE